MFLVALRVHAKHIGHPLFGDEPYGGSGPKAAALVARRGGQAAGSSTAVGTQQRRCMQHV